MIQTPLPHNERRWHPDYNRNRLALFEAISQNAGEAYGVSPAQMRSPARRQEIVAARHVAMFLLRELGYSLWEIAKFFNRDHSSVARAYKAMNERIARDDVMHSTVSLIARRAGLA